MRIVRMVHTCFKEVPHYWEGRPDKAVNFLIFENDNSEHWDRDYKPTYGKLLRVFPLVEVLTDFDPVQVEVELLQDAMRLKQAEVQMELKAMQDRINDLLMIGYDSGEASVVEVTDVTDVMAKAHDESKGADDDTPF